MTVDEMADGLVDQAQQAKRDIHRARRQAKLALNKLEELKQWCIETNTRLVIKNQIIVEGTAQAKEHSQK
jgi:hypothetical protein